MKDILIPKSEFEKNSSVKSAVIYEQPHYGIYILPKTKTLDNFLKKNIFNCAIKYYS